MAEEPRVWNGYESSQAVGVERNKNYTSDQSDSEPEQTAFSLRRIMQMPQPIDGHAQQKKDDQRGAQNVSTVQVHP